MNIILFILESIYPVFKPVVLSKLCCLAATFWKKIKHSLQILLLSIFLSLSVLHLNIGISPCILSLCFLSFFFSSPFALSLHLKFGYFLNSLFGSPILSSFVSITLFNQFINFLILIAVFFTYKIIWIRIFCRGQMSIFFVVSSSQLNFLILFFISLNLVRKLFLKQYLINLISAFLGFWVFFWVFFFFGLLFLHLILFMLTNSFCVIFSFIFLPHIVYKHLFVNDFETWDNVTILQRIFHLLCQASKDFSNQELPLINVKN